MEHLILQHISPGVEEILSVDQAGFRKDRSTGEQVLAKNGFESRLKTGALFLDLTAAYDTVWHKGLLVKLTKAIPARDSNSNYKNPAGTGTHGRSC